jgi:hypothetical protein
MAAFGYRAEEPKRPRARRCLDQIVRCLSSHSDPDTGVGPIPRRWEPGTGERAAYSQRSLWFHRMARALFLPTLAPISASAEHTAACLGTLPVNHRSLR